MMKSFAPKVTPMKICKICGGKKEYFVHNATFKTGHTYQARMETEIEAAYRIGYSEGYNKAADKALWGPGWD